MSIMVRSGPIAGERERRHHVDVGRESPPPPRARVPLNTRFASFRPVDADAGWRPGRAHRRARRAACASSCAPNGSCLGRRLATASSPSNAPVGTMMRPPCCCASSIRSGRGSSAPQLSTSTCLPAVSIGRQICSSTAAGAHSTAISAWAGRASSATTGQAIRSASSQACALAVSRAATPASSSPGTPAASRRASVAPDRAQPGDGDAQRRHA